MNDNGNGFNKKVVDLKAKLKRVASDYNREIRVPIMGASGETVLITKPGNAIAKKGKKTHPVPNLGLSFEDPIIYSTSKDQDVAIFLGEGVDSTSNTPQNWFFSQSNESGAIGAIFFSGLSSQEQLAKYRIRKMSV